MLPIALSILLAVACVLAMRFFTTAGHLRAEAARLRQEVETGRLEADALREQVKGLEASRAALQTELDVELQHARREREEGRQRLAEALQQMEGRLQKVASTFLNERTEALGKANTAQIAQILSPLQTSLGEMRRSVDGMREQSARGVAQVEKSVENMLRQAAEIGQRADNLAEAMRSNHKLQGNMGELVLSELLQSQGLQPGVHFTPQATLRDTRGRALQSDESGSRMVPDVLMHFPDKKDVVIDSKVSLSAFLDYAEAADEAARQDALVRHVESVRAHVRELAAKGYQRYCYADHEMLSYVIMFVPQENALSLALSAAPSLWREAFERGVFIAGGQTLIAALRIIELAWRGQRQRENERKIIGQAEELLRRVSLFCDRYEEIGRRLDRAAEAYTDARRTLLSGRQSLLVPARRLVELGAKSAKKLPGEAEEADAPQLAKSD